ncbi:MAG: thioesterase [Candidatus Electryonea clarkiae]|nr:thioesterase [Candidatus Electryonea clarkiae]MDP8285965.1 thioesterase [Candidatus Electryonea clarkiae]
MSKIAEIWKETYKIRDYEVRPDARVSIAVIADFLQDAAGHHAEGMNLSGYRLYEDGYAWVLTRLKISMTRYPRMGETLLIETWPTGLEKYIASRDFLLKTDKGEACGVATSAWVALNIESRKMDPLPDYVNLEHEPRKERALEFSSRSLPRLKNHEYALTFKVRESDLDFNNHVNNAHYLSWALESIPLEKREGLSPADVDILFRAEARYGDEAEARCINNTDIEKNRLSRHSIVRVEDGTELARIQVSWTDQHNV